MNRYTQDNWKIRSVKYFSPFDARNVGYYNYLKCLTFIATSDQTADLWNVSSLINQYFPAMFKNDILTIAEYRKNKTESFSLIINL